MNLVSNRMEQRIVGPTESETRDDHLAKECGNSEGAGKHSATRPGKYKYVYKSRNQRNKVETWRCSLAPSCKARIAVTQFGQVIWASGGHNHEGQYYETPDNPNNGGKNVDTCTTYFGTADRFRGESEAIYDYGSSSIRMPGSKSAENVASRKSQGEHHMKPPSQLRSGDNEDSSFGDLEIENAFSVAGCSDMATTDGEIIDDKSKILPINNEQPLAKDSKSFVLHEFSVTKDTQTMRNLLAQALECMDDEGWGEPVKSVAGTSRRTKEKQILKSKPNEDIQAKLEEEWHWEFNDEQTAEKEEDDVEINVDISEPEEPDPGLNDDEMVILGDDSS